MLMRKLDYGCETAVNITRFVPLATCEKAMLAAWRTTANAPRVFNNCGARRTSV